MGFQQGFRINTNTASLDTYHAYSKSQAGLEQNIERLSSGLRINSAKDDAAGLAISERMNNQVRGMQQANRNVQQGVNLLQTAEGGMNEIGNILGRMRELAVQSASDTVNDDDRGSLDLEFEQLKSEVDRIASATEYNNTKLIDGSYGKSTTTPWPYGTDADDIYVHSASSTTTNGTFTLGYDGTTAAGQLTLTSSAAGNPSQSITPTATGATAIGAPQEFNFDELGLTIEFFVGWTTAINPTITVTDGNQLTIQVGANNTAAEDQLKFNLGSLSAAGLGISSSDLGGASGGNAQTAIDMLDRAISKINGERSNVGSLQNRLEFTSFNLMNSVQNNAASMSTIRDADFAAEASELAKNQILTQSGTAMLAQANSLSQNVLSLIR